MDRRSCLGLKPLLLMIMLLIESFRYVLWLELVTRARAIPDYKGYGRS